MPEAQKRVEDLKKRIHGMSVGIGARPTSGSLKRVKGPDKDDSRTAGQNVIILRTHKKGDKSRNLPKRDLTKLLKKDRQLLLNIMTKAINQSTSSTIGGPRNLMSAGQKVGEVIIDGYKRRALSGKLKPVTPATKKRKIQEVGHVTPPLVRTGQLLKSFIVEQVRKLRK